MPYDTDVRLRTYLDTNQLHREQLCLGLLAIDKRFADVRPRHPRGGPDGGRDIEAIFRGVHIAYGAVGFINQANDSNEQKKVVTRKFHQDLQAAVAAQPRPAALIFFTNVNFTVLEKDLMVSKARTAGLIHIEIMDRERLRIALDSADGFSLRFQYLGLPLSEAEQAAFFARWGDDIQSVIATGFQRVEATLNRLLFLQEASEVMYSLSMRFELDREYDASEIGHFRAFCRLQLKEQMYCIKAILFGSSDKSRRMLDPAAELSPTAEPTGIEHGISGGQWEVRHDDTRDETELVSAGIATSVARIRSPYTCVSASSTVGVKRVRYITAQYTHDNFIRVEPRLRRYFKT